MITKHLFILILFSLAFIQADQKTNMTKETEEFLTQHEKIYQPILQRSQERKRVLNEVNASQKEIAIQLEKSGITFPPLSEEDRQRIIESVEKDLSLEAPYAFPYRFLTLHTMGCLSIILYFLWVNRNAGKKEVPSE